MTKKYIYPGHLASRSQTQNMSLPTDVIRQICSHLADVNEVSKHAHWPD